MNNTLAQRALPMNNALARNILLAVAGSLIVAVAAQVTVPLPVVPLTLQTLAVLAIGAAYGARLGAGTLALYAAEGAAGLPVFAQMKAGAAVIAGPTGGYIIGFIMRGIQNASTHHIMPSWFKHQPGSYPIIFFKKMLPFFAHVFAFQFWSAFFH